MSDGRNDPDGQKQHFHLRPEVSFGHILATAGFIVSAFAWGQSVDGRLTRAEVEREAIVQRMKDRDFSTTRQLDRIEGSLVQINLKLDNKADKYVPNYGRE